MKIFITGTKGNIALHLLKSLSKDHDVSLISVRGDLSKLDFTGVDVVVHAAGIVHRPDCAADLYKKFNTDLTIEFANICKSQGVGHFIFLSTSHVYAQVNNAHISVDTSTNPSTPYGQSKLAAEVGLQALSDDKFNLSIIRLPMVYGKSCPGNFLKLVKLVKVLPIIPLGYKHNLRSFIHIDNVCTVIKQVIEKKILGIVLPQDKKPCSIYDMMSAIIKSSGCKRWLLSFPGCIVKVLIKLHPAFFKVFGSFAYEENNLFSELITTEEGIARTLK